MSDKFLEFVKRQAGISDNTAHGKCIHGICARYGQNPLTIGHCDVLSFSYNPEAALFKCLDGSLVVDSGKFRHERLLRTAHLSQRTASP
jgi:hypothetical protein